MSLQRNLNQKVSAQPNGREFHKRGNAKVASFHAPIKWTDSQQRILEQLSGSTTCPGVVGVTAQAMETLPEPNALLSVASSVKSLPDNPDTIVISLTRAQIRQDQKDNTHIGPFVQCKLSGVSLLPGRIWSTKPLQLVLHDKHKPTVLKELQYIARWGTTDRKASPIKNCFFWSYMQ